MRTRNKQIQGIRKNFNIDKNLWKKLMHLKIELEYETWDEFFEVVYDRFAKSQQDVTEEGK